MVKFRHKRDGIFSNGLWSASPKIKSLVKSVHEPAPKSLGAFHKKKSGYNFTDPTQATARMVIVLATSSQGLLVATVTVIWASLFPKP